MSYQRMSWFLAPMVNRSHDLFIGEWPQSFNYRKRDSPSLNVGLASTTWLLEGQLRQPLRVAKSHDNSYKLC